MAGIVKKGNIYCARLIYKIDGKKKQKLFSLRTKQKAKALRLLPKINEKEKLYKAGIIGIDQIVADDIHYNQPLIDEFIEYKNLEGDISPKTVNLYNLALDALYGIFEGRNITLLRQEDYTYFLKKMRNQYPNINTLNIRLKSIRAFFNWMVETGKIRKVPFKIKKIPVSRKQPKYFNDEEMNKILNATLDDLNFYSTIKLYWKTGLRLRELEHTFYQNGFIRTYKPVKHGKERAIPIDIETLKCYKIAKSWDVIPSSISRKFKKLLRKLDIYYSRSGDSRHWHNLRDTFAIRTYYQTRDIYRVSKLLGHSSVTTTEIYAGFDMELLEQDFKSVVNDPIIKNIEQEKIHRYEENQSFDVNLGSKYLN